MEGYLLPGVILDVKTPEIVQFRVFILTSKQIYFFIKYTGGGFASFGWDLRPRGGIF